MLLTLQFAKAFLQGAAVTCVVIAAAVPIRAQPLTPSSRDGFRISSVSLYGSYYSSGLMFGGVSGAFDSGYDALAGGTAVFEWTSVHPRWNASAIYNPSYTRDFRYSIANSLNHVFSFNANRSVTPHWLITGSLAAEVMNTNEFLFRPNMFSRVIEAAATADDLAAAVLTGAPLDNQHLASLLTGAPILESPARGLFFGERILNASFLTSLTYTKARLRVSLSARGSRLQNLALGTPAGEDAARNLLPSSTSGGAGVDVSYSLSPRTEVGIALDSQRVITRFEDVYSTRATGYLGRRMSRRWSLQLHAGTGFFTPRRQVFPLPSNPQMVAGGSMGYKTLSHALLFSVDRSMTDTYGFGATSTLNTSAAWNWQRPGRGWRVFAGGGQQHIHSAVFENVNGWQANVGFGRRLTKETEVTFAYGYIRIRNDFAGLPGDWSTHGLRATIAWTPGVLRR